MDIHADASLQALEKALSDTFEGIAFAQVFEKQVLESPLSPPKSVIGCLLDLEEPVNFNLFYLMKNSHAVETFNAVTGLEEAQITQEMLADFVKEITNTIAGHLTSILAPAKKDMIIGLPQLVSHDNLSGYLTPGDQNLVINFQVESNEVICGLNTLEV